MMNELPLSEITLNTPLAGYLCHTSGEVLHKPGEIITEVHRALLEECTITSVLTVEASTDTGAVLSERSRKEVALSVISDTDPLPVDLFDSGGKLVAKNSTPFTSSLREKLVQQGTTSLFYTKDAMERKLFQVEKYRQLLDSDKFDNFNALPKLTPEEPSSAPEVSSDEPETHAASSEIPEERFFNHPAKMVSNKACKELMMQPDMLSIPTFEMTGGSQPQKILSGRTKDAAIACNSQYGEWLAKIEALFTSLKGNKDTPFEQFDEIACAIIDLYFTDSFYCCNLLNLRQLPASDHYLATHCLNVGIISAGIGISLGFPLWITRELTCGALLHDIGHLMTYRPFLSQKKLSSAEQQKYDNHAVVGMAMLKNMNRVPISTMMVLAQHHEYIDGTGRIFHAPSPRIHAFAQIVSAVDSFETRCRFMNTSAALAHAIAEAQSKKTNLEYTKAMVIQLSLYPIGTSVKTSKGLVCKVIGTNQQNFRKPVLRAVYSMQDDHLFPIEKKSTIDMSNTAVTITEEVSHSALKTDIANGFYDE